MSLVLFVLGLAAAAAGVMTIGFGIPINEFSLGNTLIIAGATGLASGLVVIALAITNRQLKKIADLLSSRSGGIGRSPDALDSGPGGSRSGVPRSTLSVGGDAPSRGPSYSDRPLRNAPMNAPMNAPLNAPLHAPLNVDEDPEFEQPSVRAGSAARGPGFDPIEDIPVSPRTQPRIPGTGAPPPPAPSAADANPGQRGWRPPGTRQPAAAPAEPVRQEPSIAVPERTPRPGPDVAFEWPSDRRAERIDPQQDFSADLGPAPAPPRPNGDAMRRDAPPPAGPAAENLPVSVLKSGVVDGMAYTLYTDGSIEAELAQGVVRFGSIEELRNHLEKGA